MSNTAHRRSISRLPRTEGGPRRKHPHRRLLARLYWARELMAHEAKLAYEEEFGIDEVVAPTPKVIWGAGCGPISQRVDRATQAIELAGLAQDTDAIQGLKPRRWWRKRGGGMGAPGTGVDGW